MSFTLDIDLLSLDRLDPGREHRMQLDPDAWTRALRAGKDAATGRSFVYDTSRDSVNYNVDSAGPTSITIHWWGTPAYYRSGSPEGTLAWLTGITGNRGSSAHYVATVLTNTRQSIVYQIIADSNAAWHAGNTHANWNSLGVEMMPWDASTPAWQRDALLELAAELVASLWHRWPGLRNKPLKGHLDWYNTECPGSYYPRLGDIYRRAQQLYDLYAGSFGQFRKPGTTTTKGGANTMLKQTITNSDGQKVTVETVLRYVDKRLIQLEEVVHGMGVLVIGEDGKPSTSSTDLAREAAWNRYNFRAVLDRLDRVEASLARIEKGLSS